jgi:hypothetical protein
MKFNFKEYNKNKIHKTAFYDSGVGHIQKNGRTFQNCYKCAVEEGLTPMKAWTKCKDEYQENTTSDWLYDINEKGNKIS